MRSFIIHWMDGKKKTVTGENIADACTKAGIGAGALRAIDYYEEIANANRLEQDKGRPC